MARRSASSSWQLLGDFRCAHGKIIASADNLSGETLARTFSDVPLRDKLAQVQLLTGVVRSLVALDGRANDSNTHVLEWKADAESKN
jgi:hypothetical protein